MPLTELDPRTAFVTIDFQSILRVLPLMNPLDVVVSNARRLSVAFRDALLPVVHVKVSYSSDFGDALQPRADAPLHLSELPDGWDEYLDELGIEPSDVLVTKRQFGAFYGTDLDLQLRRRGVTGVVLAGVSTSGGVESTARAAAEHGYNVAIVTDAVTDLNPVSHADALENTLPLFCELDVTEVVIAMLAARPAPSMSGETIS
jgi:nicotinamidase-related amidase